MQPELHIIRFMKEHSDWRDLLRKEPYLLKISEYEKYAVLTYNQIGSDFSYPICREARGLIVDTTNFRVVRMAFTKFFNIDEKYVDTIDWNTASATEKIDGSLMSVWCDNGVWHTSTMNTVDADTCMFGLEDKTFQDLFDEAAENSGLDFDKLNPNFCYTFEMVSPENRIVIAYSESELYHIMTRDMETLKEVEVDIGIQKPKFYRLTDENAYRNIVEKMDSSHEGIVVRDAEGHRVKIKTKTYFIMHHLRSNMSLDNAIMLVFKNDYDEFVSYFSEYKELFDAIQFTVDTIRQNAKDMDTLMAKHKQEYAFLSSAEDKKRISGCLTGKESSLFIRAMVAYKGSLAEQLDKYMATTQFITKYIANTRPYWVKLYKTYQDLLEINADVAKALNLKQEKSL